MKIRHFVLPTALSLLLTVSGLAAVKNIETLAEQAASADVNEAKQAISELRALGKNGLDALFAKYGAEIEQFSETGIANENWQRIAFAIDSVAQQKDAYASHLFWFNNLDEAQKEAARTKRPVLSLRLLGNLTEEFSCANSRLFRAILYPNAQISKYLSENYILHWKSVRPAPKVTIDFGDGRKIERTITGNSIHYTLDENGNIIDALPGLYNPQEFLQFLSESKLTFANAKSLQNAAKIQFYIENRANIFSRIRQDRTKHLATAKIKLDMPAEPKILTPRAIDAAPIAVTKMATTSEISILTAISDDFSKFQPQINLDDWKKLAALYAFQTRIDKNSVAFIKRQTKNTVKDAEFTELLKSLGVYVALDTTRNDFLFRPQVYEQISQNPRLPLEQLNDRIYSGVFLTPRADEWLGLYTPTIYTALDGNGIIK